MNKTWLGAVATTCHHIILRLIDETDGKMNPETFSPDQLQDFNIAAAYLEMYAAAISNGLIKEAPEDPFGYFMEQPKIVH